MLPYKPKFPKQSYQPKFKPKELISIARKICSNEFYKSTIDPVEFEWIPKKGIVYLHMQFGGKQLMLNQLGHYHFLFARLKSDTKNGSKK